MGFFSNDDGSDGIDFGQAIIKLLGGSEPSMSGAAPPDASPPAAPPGPTALGGAQLDPPGSVGPSPSGDSPLPPPGSLDNAIAPPQAGGAAGMPPTQDMTGGPNNGQLPPPPSGATFNSQPGTSNFDPKTGTNYPPQTPITMGTTGPTQGPPMPPQGATGTPPPTRVPVGPGGGSTQPPPIVAPPPAQHGWLNGIFGSPDDPNRKFLGMDPKTVKSVSGALAEGLKSVGSNWNKPGLAAAAGSAGAAIGGGNKAEDDFFKETAEAKKEALAYAAQGDREGVNKALIKLREAQTLAVQQHGTISSRQNDYRNTDLGRLQSADAQASKEIEGLRKSMETDAFLKNPDPVKAAAAQKDFEKKAEDIRNQRRSEYLKGYTPEMGKKIEQTGKPAYGNDGKIDIKATQSQAHQPSNVREFNAIVPVGGYYVDPGDHKLYRRTSAAPPPADAPGVGILSVGVQPGEGSQPTMQGEGVAV